MMHICLHSHELQNSTVIEMYTDRSGCWGVRPDLVLLIYSLMQSFLIPRYMYRWMGAVAALAWPAYPRSVGVCSRDTFAC